MKRVVFTIVFFSMLLIPGLRAEAQNIHDAETTSVFDTKGFPQWAKDFRRWDIIAFGTFPFSMFFVNFFYDMYRWNRTNGMDFSTEGRRYAPWPFKSAGAVELTGREFGRTILFAAGLSVVFAFTDLLIVKMKRKKEAKIETPSPVSYIIEEIQYGDAAPEEELNVTGDTGQDSHNMDTANPGEPPFE
jgi:hypothetical protein